MKIGSQCFRRCVNQKILMLASDAREGKEEEKFSGNDLDDLVVLLRNDIDVVTTEDKIFCNLSKNIWRGSCAGMADNSVERWLHRAGGNFKRLEKISADTYCN